MEQLIKEAIKGDIDAFDKLLQLEKPRLLAKAFQLTGNRADAEDIVQESIIRAFKSLHQLRQPNYFSTWLFRILIHESYAFFRNQKRSLGIEVKLMKQTEVTVSPNPPSFDSLYEALSSLKDECRTTIVLHYFYDFSIREISSLLDKPVNTVKTYLFRGRKELKQQLQQKLNIPITSKEMASMLKEDLAKLAISFVEVPKHLELVVEDYQSDRATYLWSNNNLDDGASVTLDSKGKLIALTRNPSNKLEETVDIQEQQSIAEQFLTAQHPEALSYLQLTSLIERKESTLFVFGQLVGGVPLKKFQTDIEVSKHGEVTSFYYKGYTKTPPHMPDTMIDKDKILEQIVRKETWHLKLCYLPKNTYNVEKSGLFKIYTNSALIKLFDAKTGKTNFQDEESSMELKTIPISNVLPMKMAGSIKEIVGIPDSMVLEREQETDNEHWQVWREKEENDTPDRSFEGFFRNRTENTVKLKIDKVSKQLKEFVWFKKREGNLQLSFEQCKQIACAFIATYFTSFLPYVHLKVEEPSFNDSNRAFFRFPLHDGHGMFIEGENFYLSVNRTTGFIDMCNGPDVPIESLEANYDQPVLPIEELQQAFRKIDACLTWSVYYEAEEPFEELKYMVCQADSKRRIVGINAFTGELITYNFR